MSSDMGNYAQHARFWDWSGHDRTEEEDYWLKYAAKYGKNVLIPMCAWGETGAYMAQRGCCVTAFDITPEMIAEGKQRFGNLPGLTLAEGDVTDFQFDIPPVDFCFSMDFEVLPTMEDIKKALACIHRHLRVGGGLVISAQLPPKKSDSWPLNTYLPLKQMYPGMKVWKTGSGHNDAKTGRRYIAQTFYAEHEDGETERFDHSFYLQCHSRRRWRAALKACGFDIVKQGSRELNTGYGGGNVIEAIKKA